LVLMEVAKAVKREQRSQARRWFGHGTHTMLGRQTALITRGPRHAMTPEDVVLTFVDPRKKVGTPRAGVSSKAPVRRAGSHICRPAKIFLEFGLPPEKRVWLRFRASSRWR
jgi:hypothetical protein